MLSFVSHFSENIRSWAGSILAAIQRMGPVIPNDKVVVRGHGVWKGNMVPGEALWWTIDDVRQTRRHGRKHAVHNDTRGGKGDRLEGKSEHSLEQERMA